jgi:RNA 2',3'-cyclic 3'-phosphodiesterase
MRPYPPPSPLDPDAAPAGWQRCFIALEPDQATRDALGAIPIRPPARPVPYGQLHLTVTFLGALTLDQGSALSHALAAQPVPLAPVAVTRIEHWPRATHPRLTVATLAMSDEFVALDWRIRSLMLDFGLPVDARAFRPHVTLARFRRDAAVAGRAPDVPANLAASFDALTLFSSTLAPSGSRYRVLASVPVTPP